MEIKSCFNFVKISRKQQILVIYIIFILIAAVRSQSANQLTVGEQNSLAEDEEFIYPNQSPIFYEEGDSCTTQSGKSGKCVLQSQCDNLRELMRTNEPPVTCGFGVFEEIICCPRKERVMDQQEKEDDRASQGIFTIPLKNKLEITSSTTTTSTQETLKEKTTDSNGRKEDSDLVDIFEQLVKPWNSKVTSKSGNIGGRVTPHPFLPQINDRRPSPNRNPWLTAENYVETNTQSDFGKREHKITDDSIIFPSESNEFLWKSTTKSPVITRSKERASVEACNEIDKGLTPGLTPHIIGGINVPLGEYPHMAALGFPVIGTDDYDFRCGGSLIAPRFVLTAAHCVIRRDSSPTIVRMGFVSFNSEEQMREAVDKKIQRIHIHPNYTNSRSYHDIAILELDSNVTYSSQIYPTCLYTEPDDPPTDSILYVTGWGVTSTATRSVSSILLKAKLTIRSLDQCNASYVGQGNRQLPHGLDTTQMCAYDPGGKRDACQGDSGGPLNLVLDESLLQYRLVGITSAGFSCATLTPSLYTRVSSYLDFIESIVWPRTNPS